MASSTIRAVSRAEANSSGLGAGSIMLSVFSGRSCTGSSQRRLRRRASASFKPIRVSQVANDESPANPSSAV